MFRSVLFFCLLIIGHISKSQSAPASPPCNSPGCSQLDFWLGDWDLTWNDTSKGSNTVTRTLNGCVIQENFIDPVGNFTGMSWSSYNPKSGKWRQTWVDNQGGYIVLSGKSANGQTILATEPVLNAQGKKIISRMIFYNIKEDSFEWNWENSSDEGKTWQLNWKIFYKRKK